MPVLVLMGGSRPNLTFYDIMAEISAIDTFKYGRDAIETSVQFSWINIEKCFDMRKKLNFDADQIVLFFKAPGTENTQYEVLSSELSLSKPDLMSSLTYTVGRVTLSWDLRAMNALFHAKNGYGLLYTGDSWEVIEMLDGAARMLQEYDLPGAKEIFIMSQIGAGADPVSEYFDAIPETNQAPFYLLKPEKMGNIAIKMQIDTDPRTLSTEDILDWVIYQTVSYDIKSSWDEFSRATTEDDTEKLAVIKDYLMVLGKHKSITKANIEKKGVIMLEEQYTSDL